jgi:hypothetical protein
MDLKNFKKDFKWLLKYKPVERGQVVIKNKENADAIFKYLPLDKMKHLTRVGKRDLVFDDVDIMLDSRYLKGTAACNVRWGVTNVPKDVKDFWENILPSWIQEQMKIPVYISLVHQLQDPEYLFKLTLIYHPDPKGPVISIDFVSPFDFPFVPGYVNEAISYMEKRGYFSDREMPKHMKHFLKTGEVLKPSK